jgi:CBS domain-containing protein
MTSNPEQVDASDTIHTVVEKMRDLEVGIVPVVRGGNLHGVITDRDITIRVIAENADMREVKAGEIATPHPVTITPGMDMDEATRLMSEHQVRRLPVVENGHLVGILSLGDVSVDGSTGAAGQALKHISTPSEPER